MDDREKLSKMRVEYDEMKRIYDNVSQIPKRNRSSETNTKLKRLGEKMFMHNLEQITLMNRLAGIEV